MKQEMILDENDFANSVKNFLHQMKIDSEEFKEYLEKMDMKIHDQNDYEFYFYPGIPKKIETKREISIKLTEEEILEIEKVHIQLLLI